ncbi:MAG: hypothetical protein Q8K37_07255 [Alphaproteobacteria bacterium]|nr:hypothetical protein [Alphaproteobacteria bacterium]
MYQQSIQELRKNISYIVSRLIGENMDPETRHVVMDQTTNALLHCPTGQKEGISSILLSLSTEVKNEAMFDKIYKILAIQKNIVFKLAIMPGDDSQNVHVLSHYFDELEEELGLTSHFETFSEQIGIADFDPFGGHLGNALDAFYTMFDPDYILETIMRNIENETDWNSREKLSDLDNPLSKEDEEKTNECLMKSEQNRPIKINDILGYLKSKKIIIESFSGGILDSKGWEPYFEDNPLENKFPKLKVEGIQKILIDMNILKRKSD